MSTCTVVRFTGMQAHSSQINDLAHALVMGQFIPKIHGQFQLSFLGLEELEIPRRGVRIHPGVSSWASQIMEAGARCRGLPAPMTGLGDPVELLPATAPLR
jgi:hypothetical protein